MAKRQVLPKPTAARIASTPFGASPGPDGFNASEVVPIADARFLFCDNNINDALLEMRITPDGGLAGPLVRRALSGIAPGSVDDMEGMAIVEHDGTSIVFVTPSLSLKQRKGRIRSRRKRGKAAPARAGLLRVRFGPGEHLDAELIPDFRSWLLDHSRPLRKARRLLPDDGGVNVEGLGWDPQRNALLFGIRTPVPKRGPLVVRVRVKDLAGPWTLENLEYLPPVYLRIGSVGEEQGIRSMEFIPSLAGSLVVTGNSTSRSKAPFLLHYWDGNDEGRTTRFEQVRFAKRMKTEGVTYGTVEGVPVIVFVDDGGGYSVLRADDERLRLPVS